MSNPKFKIELTNSEIISLLNAIDTQMIQWSKTYTKEQIQNAPDGSAIRNLINIQEQLKPMKYWG